MAAQETNMKIVSRRLLVIVAGAFAWIFCSSGVEIFASPPGLHADRATPEVIAEAAVAEWQAMAGYTAVAFVPQGSWGGVFGNTSQ